MQWTNETDNVFGLLACFRFCAANPSPEFDDMLALRHGAALLYELYITTGDERFYEARVALVRTLVRCNIYAHCLIS
eukprot:COSAG06_NODE_160_length_21658_cov_6.433462_2_plen_77_part_00